MVHIDIKATNMELTDAIRSHVLEKVNMLEKYLDDDPSIQGQVEVGKTTHHHNKGEVFRAELNLSVPGDMIRAVEEHEDLYAAIDTMKETASRELRRAKNKQKDQKRKGGRSLKALFKRVTGSNNE